MRPIQLEMTNFGPYRDATIDFEHLDQDQVFLISGDTGAGKSTIFDAMTVALFNATTGEREPREMRSTFATPEDPLTKVVFYFENGDSLYKLERVIEQERKAARGSGTTRQKPDANLAIVKSVGGPEIAKIASKPADVASEIDNLLHLTADQFKQIILLPQNEFRKFLNSKTADKQDILQKIFGTQLFDRFKFQVKVQFDQASRANSQYEHQLQGEFASQVWDDGERQALVQAPSHERLSLVEGFVNGHQASLNLATEHYQASAKISSEADKAYQDALTLDADFKRLAELEQRYQVQVTEKAQTIAHERGHLSDLQWANGLSKTVSGISETQKAIAKTELDLIAAKEKSEHYHHILGNVQQLLLNMETERQSIKDKRELILVWTSLKESAKSRERLLREVDAIQNEKQLLVSQLSDGQAQEAMLQAELKDLQAQLVDPEDLTKLTRAYDQAVLRQANLKETQVARDAFSKKIQLAKARLEDEVAKQAQLEQALTQVTEDLSKQLEDRRVLMVAQLREELEDGQACVVCGAIDHPYAHDHLNADEEALRMAMDKVEGLKADKTRLQTQFENQAKSIVEHQEALAEQEAELAQQATALEDKYMDFKSELQAVVEGQDLPVMYEANDVMIVLSSLQQSIAEKQAQADRLQAKLSKVTETLEGLKLSIQENQGQVTTQDSLLADRLAQLDEIALDEPDLKTVEVYDQKINDAQAVILDFEKAEKGANDEYHEVNAATGEIDGQVKTMQLGLENRQTDLKNLTEQLQACLDDPTAPTDDQLVLADWVSELEAGRLNQLTHSIATFDTMKAELEQNIVDLKQALVDKKVPELEVLMAQRDLAANHKDEALRSQTDAQHVYQATHSTLENIKAILERQGEGAERYQELGDLYDTINGKNPDKLKLETYVVQAYLRQVIVYANRHYFPLLTNGRYQFRLSDQARSGRTDSGLDIDVDDLVTGATRSTKTLSGGETFIAALAIALSLSEVVQNSSNGVAIEALFIDEGFGSLDKETLEKAMESLERIGENRMVGVISHVEEMKERISQQLVIEKQGDGSSIVTSKSKN
jgi:exonuclease SbcC